ncbi:DNA transposition protein [Inquilinus sp. OTU3971]|uniref:DNA transposition protein n=1 Tax=Inquilinus sp. OTU3971 TaxID=3043855 RepID=UPI00313B192D
MARRDDQTLDIFNDWQPEQAVTRFPDATVQSVSLRGRIARAVSAALHDCEAEGGRAEIAGRMSAWLEGETVSKHVLDAYASEGREEHTISAVRLAALIHATGDIRPLQLIAEMFGYAVIEDRFLPWIELGQIADRKVELDRRYESARRAARRRPAR